MCSQITSTWIWVRHCLRCLPKTNPGIKAIVSICWLVIYMALILWCIRCTEDTLPCWPTPYSTRIIVLTPLHIYTIPWEDLLEQCHPWRITIFLLWCTIGWIQWLIPFLIHSGLIIHRKVWRRVSSILTNYKDSCSRYKNRPKWTKNCWRRLTSYRNRRPRCSSLF